MRPPPSPPAKTWRLPLQTGEAALRAVWVAALLWVPALAFAAATAVLLWGLDLDGDFAMWVSLPALLLGFFCWKQVERAWRFRPSDLLLTSTDFKVLGGPHEGLSFAYDTLKRAYVKPGAPESMTVVDHATSDDDTDLHSLWLETKAGPSVCLAFSGAPAEVASLEDVAETLSQALLPSSQVAAEAPPEVLRCGHCQGPVAPSADATTTCPWCAKAVEVPSSTREKVTASERLARHPAQAVARVLDQPSARVVDVQYRVVASLMFAAWPLAAGVAGVNLSRGQTTLGNLGLLALFVAGTVFGALAVFRMRLVERQALRLLTLRFTALGPDAAGKPRRCRSCLGPLPETGARALVTCTWCDAPNVLGTDLRRQARAAEGETRSLEEVLSRRQAARRAWWLLGALGVALLVGSAWALVAALAPGR